MKKILLVTVLLIFSYSAKAQYCGNYARPDYKEIINHSDEPTYKPCENQTRKGWFYMQQQRLEQRMKELQRDHANDIRSVAGVYADYIKEYYYWTYETRPQFERGINLLNIIDTVLDQIELGKFKK